VVNETLSKYNENSVLWGHMWAGDLATYRSTSTIPIMKVSRTYSDIIGGGPKSGFKILRHAMMAPRFCPSGPKPGKRLKFTLVYTPGISEEERPNVLWNFGEIANRNKVNSRVSMTQFIHFFFFCLYWTFLCLCIFVRALHSLVYSLTTRVAWLRLVCRVFQVHWSE
jgi:hypothetical protein